MKRLLSCLFFVAIILCSAMESQSTEFVFQPSPKDMDDLQHGYYYGWSVDNAQAIQLGKELSEGYKITSAELVFTNIYNWQYKEIGNQLSTYLLSDAPPVPQKQDVPLIINGITQGTTTYTYTKTTTTTKEGKSPTPPAGYTLSGTITNNKGKITGYIYTKTTISTKTNSTGVCPQGYTLTSSIFVPKIISMPAGVMIGSDVWERANPNGADPNWGVGVNTLVGQWSDDHGGTPRGFNLVYDFNNELINQLSADASDGSFGFGMDPRCHFFNDGIVFTVETDPPVPEPSTLLFLSVGLAGFCFLKRRNKE